MEARKIGAREGDTFWEFEDRFAVTKENKTLPKLSQPQQNSDTLIAK